MSVTMEETWQPAETQISISLSLGIWANQDENGSQRRLLKESDLKDDLAKPMR